MLETLIEPSISSALTVISKTGLDRRLCEKRPGVCILMFHGFTDEKNPPGLENHTGLHQDIGEFRKLARILAEEFHVISLDDLLASEKEGKELPPASVVLTFDDGYASNYELAYPILKEFGLHATIYVATGFVDEGQYLWPDRLEYALGSSPHQKIWLDYPGLPGELDLSDREQRARSLGRLDPAIKLIPQESYLDAVAHIEARCGVSLRDAEEVPDIYRPLTWEQIREMEAGNHISIGAHTHNHRILGRCDAETIREELEENLRLLRIKGRVEQPTFAYPNGQLGDYNDETEEILEDFGIEVALTTRRGLNTEKLDLMRLQRIASPRLADHAAVICSGVPFQIKKNIEKILRRNILF